MKIIWLCSWYPHSTDNLDGDFVERHAKSLATQQKVDVIHVVQNVNLLKAETVRIEFREDINLRAKIYYVPYPQTGIKKLDQVLFNRRFYAQLKQALKVYINENGKPDIIHVHVPVKMGVGAVWLKRKYNLPFVVTEHSSAYFEHIPENYFSRNRYFKLSTKVSFENAEVVSSVSNWLLNRLTQMFSIRKTQLIRNAVDTSVFFPIPVNNLTKILIHVSMMYPLKNVSGILKALVQVNSVNTNWQMVFVGPDAADNFKLAVDMGLEKQIIWKGELRYTEVAKEMQKADALVHFSTYENLPCVVNEALCCGLPVISSDVGGIAEIINNSNGILVENKNTNQLAEAIIFFLQNQNKYNKEQISKAAAELFNYEIIGKELIEMYYKVLKQN